MKMRFSRLVKDLVTERDGESYDIARLGWVVCMLTVIAGAVWNATQSGTMELLIFAQAIGIISGAHGAAVMFKQNTEGPYAPPEKNVSVDVNVSDGDDDDNDSSSNNTPRRPSPQRIF